jgi:hypothetical protein
VIAGGVGGGFVTLLLVAVAIVVLLRAAQRRRRLELGSPPQRVLGAWNEVLDALALAGAPPPSHLAAAEVAGHAADVAQLEPGRHGRGPRPAAPPLDDLARLVNTVAFADSASVGATADTSASAAASTAVEYASALRSRRGWLKRLLWTIDPRPLRSKRR